MKKIRKISSAFLLVICVLMQSVTITATEPVIIEMISSQDEIVQNSNSSSVASVMASLGTCSLTIGAYDNGVGITYVTRATGNASKIGVKNVVFYEKTLTGWREIPVSDDYSTNAAYHTGGVVYTASMPGKTYKATCTHYAIIGGREYTLDNDTSELVYN